MNKKVTIFIKTLALNTTPHKIAFDYIKFTGENMTYYIVDSDKTVEQAATDLETAVSDNKFGTLHIHPVSDILKSKVLT